MTIWGFVVRPEWAMMWVDSETYIHDEPGSEFSKLGVNALVPVVATGCGNVQMLVDTQDELRRVKSIGGMSMALGKMSRPEGGVLGAVGFSPRHGRLLGCVVDGANGSAAQFRSEAAYPNIDRAEVAAVQGRLCVIGLALAQMTTLRRTHDPRSSGRTLIIAEVTKHGLKIERVPDFGAMAQSISLAPTFPTCGATEQDDQVFAEAAE